tara:strand:- start:486 stop:593 length:108 start_codon:yes stop_codon:yes gene_type:complete
MTLNPDKINQGFFQTELKFIGASIATPFIPKFISL